MSEDLLWYKDAIIYQTHVKAFFDTDGDGTGDFRGLTRKLDYIRDLGANTIWLLPFYPSPMRDDGYDIADYRNIDPRYGSRRDFRRFVGAAHRRGLRVITEFIINHTSDQHPWFQAARRAPKGSKKRDFYVWSDDDKRFAETRIIFTDTETSNWAWDPVAQQYYWHRFFSHQPDLNHNNPQVVKAVIRLMRFWLDLGVDGLRLDAIPYLCVREGTNNENLPETHAVIKQMRAVVDHHYGDRIFLAEANQWPEDVRDYFGDGDECHLAYHFPLMPRIYMALAQEDRYPVVEILEQTPEIPPSCQWAIFLRNHDELTLEMVSDRERDYMYRTYAADPRMRINVGIRRRLAPLLGNDQDKIRLLHSLLLSMPGSPILYYGDELGMGDNIYLGDRNGVRTPMQWSPDRNAGFSRADPERLYLPPIMDAIYGYQSVNVEAQQRHAASLLNWMRRIIEVRKAHRVFGRGSLRFLDPGNRKILAYVREGGAADKDGEALLCVANLGRGAQPVELDLASFRGRVPIELLGQTAFPPIGDLPYLLTLPGHGFYWFLLSQDAAAPDWHEEHLAPLQLATLVTPEGWRSLQPTRAMRRDASKRALSLMENKILPAYLSTRRWYAAKGRPIRAVSFAQWQEWREWLLTLIRVELEDGGEQYYFFPLAILWDDGDGTGMAGPGLGTALARVRRQATTGTLCDALADARFAREMTAAIRAGDEISLDVGSLVFQPTSAMASLVGDLDARQEVRQPPDRSYSAAILDNRLFLKIYRRLRPGLSSEIEMGRFLTEVSPFAGIVPLAGTLDFRDEDGLATTLAVLQKYVPNQGDLWGVTLDLLGRLGDAYGDRVDEWDSDLAHVSYAALIDTLGRRLAELHRALARTGVGPAFEPEPVAATDPGAWRERLHADALTTLARLEAQLQNLSDQARAVGEEFLAASSLLLARLMDPLPADLDLLKIRCHGNLHLGQVLVVGNDVVMIDFEGEPTGGPGAGRLKECPLIDVAGILRSFRYAAARTLTLVSQDHPAERERMADPFARWSGAMSERFLAAYREAAADARLYPPAAEQSDLLLRHFMLRRALYEIRYELHNRPEWVAIPLQGVLELL
jgi:maltose alpha-D-glucosyltransferase/alpha-amylase